MGRRGRLVNKTVEDLWLWGNLERAEDATEDEAVEMFVYDKWQVLGPYDHIGNDDICIEHL